MPMIKCDHCKKETWWGIWEYKGDKLCGWCNEPLEVVIEKGEVKAVSVKG